MFTIINHYHIILHHVLSTWKTKASSERTALYCKPTRQPTLKSFSKISKKVSISCCDVFQRHTWYLTEEMVVFSLFDSNLSQATRNELAAKIDQTVSSDETLEIRKPTLPSVTEKSKLCDFVCPRSKVLFDLLEFDTEFLAYSDWSSADE